MAAREARAQLPSSFRSSCTRTASVRESTRRVEGRVVAVLVHDAPDREVGGRPCPPSSAPWTLQNGSPRPDGAIYIYNAVSGEYSLVRLRSRPGARHQIRVHTLPHRPQVAGDFLFGHETRAPGGSRPPPPPPRRASLNDAPERADRPRVRAAAGASPCSSMHIS